jgi:hypothetical protein
METKPKINMGISIPGLQESSKFHRDTEIIARNILDMMREKTLMYGGNDNSIPLEEKIHRAYYEGVGRKANRLPAIGKRVLEGVPAAKRELLDTYIDIVGYGLLALNAMVEDLQGE